MKYRHEVIIEATQWFKNGDHPFDNVFRPFEDTGLIPTEPREGKIVRYFRDPGVDGNEICEDCGFSMAKHGFLDGKMNNAYAYVCPGDYIVLLDDEHEGESLYYFSMCEEDFKNQYELID